MDVLFSIDFNPNGSLDGMIPDEAKERITKTNFILEEYDTGILDETEAGEALFNHLFGGEVRDTKSLED